MTFRRRNRLNSSESQSGTCENSDREIFPSKLYSIRPLAFVSNSTDVYETLAYSGGTLPRSFQNVSLPLIFSLVFHNAFTL